MLCGTVSTEPPKPTKRLIQWEDASQELKTTITLQAKSMIDDYEVPAVLLPSDPLYIYMWADGNNVMSGPVYYRIDAHTLVKCSAMWSDKDFTCPIYDAMVAKVANVAKWPFIMGMKVVTCGGKNGVEFHVQRVHSAKTDS